MSDAPHPPPAKPREPLADSPWFWMLLFATMALGALVVVAPKYALRQARLEEKLEGVVRSQPGARDRMHEVGTPAEEREVRIVPLNALAVVLTSLVLLGWICLFVTRRAPRPTPTGSTPTGKEHSYKEHS